MERFLTRAAATLLVIALLIGCSKHQNDEAIAQDVQSKLAADPVAKGSAVSVTVKDGKVTLKGTVKDPATQQRVEQIASEEPGAKGVTDETSLSGVSAAEQAEQAANTPSATPAPAVEKPDETSLSGVSAAEQAEQAANTP